MEIFAEEIDLRAMVDEVVSTMTPLIEKNRNVLTTSIDDSLETMTGDLTKLRQVLFNLISNASKITEDGEIQLIVAVRLTGRKFAFCFGFGHRNDGGANLATFSAVHAG